MRAATGPAARPCSSSSATSPTASRTHSKIIRSLQQLQKEAPRSGGRVVVILGNHEAMNLLGDYRYTTPGEYAAFADSQSAARRDRVYEANRARLEAAYRASTRSLRPSRSEPTGWPSIRSAGSSTGSPGAPSGELGQWATRNPAVAKIGGTLFVHGGLSGEYAKIPMDEINRRVAAAMVAADDSPKSILNDALGRCGIAGSSAATPRRRPSGPPCPRARPARRSTRSLRRCSPLTAPSAWSSAIRRILPGIAITNGGRLARIDTGISRYYGGPLSWLEIIGDQMIPHVVGRPAS